MGRKGSWFSSIKKTLSPSSKEKKSQKSDQKSIVENGGGSCDPHPFPPPQEVKPLVVQDDSPLVVQDEPPQSASFTTAAASTAVVPLAAVTPQYAGKSREEVAAIKIQTIYRGYLAKRALWGLRGLVRLKTVIEGRCVRQQTVNTLKCLQSLSHLQSEISSRRSRISEENQALQKQLLRVKEITDTQNGDEWDLSAQSKEEIEAKLLSKYDAAMRRERAMAYSYSHQQPWKKSGGTRTNMLFMNPANPQWGWSWSERYKDHGNDHVSIKTGIDIKTEIAKSYARRQLNSAPSTPRSKGGGGLAASRKPNTGPSPRAYNFALEANQDDDAKSVSSVKSERNRRHSVAGSIVDAKSAKVKTRRQGVAENGGGSATSAAGVNKRLSFRANPKRGSGSPRVETTVCDGLEQEALKKIINIVSGTKCYQTTPFIVGLAVAGTAYAGRYGIQAWNAFKARPVGPAFRKFYQGGFQPQMTRREAALILGVRESSALDKIKEAHRRVMLANHPDAGGSHYLASKISEAKEMMLRKKGNTGSAF
ncbi:hypothetical protein SSX86_009198 [Deinandra increscens subsp. villosa]|uniref:J domain-containing protein n=1 Tax=Deinandra increscens subsp. villosa TaxID=3103831 RepID=A0AAP0H2S1_9ASTR